MLQRIAQEAERRIIYCSDICATRALAIAGTTPLRTALALKNFMNRYLLSRGYFRITLELTFGLEFHIPYYALRRGPRTDDKRQIHGKPLRSCTLLPLGDQQQRQDFYYEATNSLLIFGIDEWVWTAYCFVDSYFISNINHREYFEVAHPTDPCLGGSKLMEFPFWNPREYFIAILSRRLRQAAREWVALVNAFEVRMAAYEQRTLLNFFDNEELTHTKDLTLAGTTLRHFRDSLAATLVAWEDFERDGIQALTLQGCEGLRPKWDEYLSDIRGNISDLRNLRLLLSQRLEFFNTLRDGVSG